MSTPADKIPTYPPQKPTTEIKQGFGVAAMASRSGRLIGTEGGAWVGVVVVVVCWWCGVVWCGVVWWCDGEGA